MWVGFELTRFGLPWKTSRVALSTIWNWNMSAITKPRNPNKGLIGPPSRLLQEQCCWRWCVPRSVLCGFIAARLPANHLFGQFRPRFRMFSQFPLAKLENPLKPEGAARDCGTLARTQTRGRSLATSVCFQAQHKTSAPVSPSGVRRLRSIAQN
jgi:hypothetical protein